MLKAVFSPTPPLSVLKNKKSQTGSALTDAGLEPMNQMVSSWPEQKPIVEHLSNRATQASQVPILLKESPRIWKKPRIVFNNPWILQFVLFCLFFFFSFGFHCDFYAQFIPSFPQILDLKIASILTTFLLSFFVLFKILFLSFINYKLHT